MELPLLSGIGLALPAGLNAYIPLLGLALAERFGVVALGKPWNALGEWWAIALIGVLLAIEILADKIPAVDHVNDLVQTVIRPAAGAIVMVAASGQVGRNYPVVMIVLGIVLAGTVHAVKATSRPVINVTSGGFAAPVVSAVEDIFALFSTLAALLAPLLVLVAIAAVVWAGVYVSRVRKRIGRERLAAVANEAIAEDQPILDGRREA